MSDCRHDELTVTVGVETDTGNIVDVVYCSNPACDVDARAIIADLRAQRDAAEKRAADAEAEVERQKAAVSAVEKLIDDLLKRDGCPPKGERGRCEYTPDDQYPCRVCWGLWAYGEEVQDAKTD